MAALAATLTLSNTRKHLSAPQRDATSFSLSSSWLKFSTHSFTVEKSSQRIRQPQLALCQEEANAADLYPRCGPVPPVAGAPL